MRIKFIVVIIVSLVIGHNSRAQNYSRDLGKIGEVEINLKKFEPDSLAEAVILFDIGVTKFYINTDLHIIVFSRKKRIKILEESGNSYGEVAILLYNNETRAEKVTFFEGTSYYPDNGHISKSTINLSNGFDEKINDNLKHKKFVFPNVKAGTIIEFSYEVETPFHFNLPDWQFQDRIPTVYSSYEVGMVPFYEYVFVVQGISKFDNYVTVMGKKSSIGMTKYTELDHKFEMRDIAAFRDESFITSINDYIMKIDFQLSRINHLSGGSELVITSWPELSNELLNYSGFGGYIKRSAKYAKKMLDEELSLKHEDMIGNAGEIIDFAKKAFNWNNRFGKYASKNPNELIRDRGGSAADINLFTIALLQEAGIKADPIILSTRNNGKVRNEYPIESLFNYVAMILTIDDKIILADATVSNVPFDRLPVWCLNDKGLIIRKNDALWVDLQTNVPSENSIILDFKINPQTLKAELSCVMHTTELEAYHLRDKYKDDTTAIMDLFLEKGFKNTSRIKTSHYENASRPYVIAAKGTSDIDRIDNQLIIAPLLHFPTKKMPFTQESRSYPIDFVSPQLEKYKCQIDLPKGYSLAFVPEDFKISNDLIEVQYSTFLKDSTLEVNGLIFFKKSTYPESDYSKLKFYFEKIIEKFNEQIALKPNKT